ncbi:MAG TPA: glycosyltransferase family 2 protein [bacterium]|nr:glycosyltransferase family 2 protein [bacterium]
MGEGGREIARSSGEAPLVSVVVPCRNEEAFIAKAVGSVLANEWPGDRLEVLVVDGMSADGTRDIIKEIATRDARVRLVDNPDLFAGSAMKVGLAAARGDYVVRVDAHAEIPPQYVTTGVGILEHHPEIWAVGGPVDRVAAGEEGRLVAAVNSNIFATGNTPVRVGRAEGPVDAVLYPVWRRDVFDRVGDFDESLVRNQDDDFHYRIREAGGVIYQTQKMRAKYYVRGSVRQLLRQYNQYAFWKMAVAKKHGRFIDWKPLVPPAFFAALAITAAGGFVTPYLWLVSGALAAAYIIADVAASAAVAAKTGLRNFFKASAIFPVFHLRYALGIVAGIWCFYVRGFSPAETARRGIFNRLTR